MTIIDIKRDTGTNGNNIPIMRLQTTAFLQDVVSPGWLTTQQPFLDAISGGSFQWDQNDVVLVETVDPVTGDPDSQTFFYLQNDVATLMPTTLVPMQPVMPNFQGLTAHPGGGQANAVTVPLGITVVTVVGSAADSVKLPTDVLGQTVVIYNATGTNLVSVFPQVGEKIGGTVNASVAVPPNSARLFIGIEADDWAAFGG